MKSTATTLSITYDENNHPQLTLSLSCSRSEIANDIAELKQEAQRQFEQAYGKGEFEKIFGRNYL